MKIILATYLRKVRLYICIQAVLVKKNNQNYNIVKIANDQEINQKVNNSNYRKRRNVWCGKCNYKLFCLPCLPLNIYKMLSGDNFLSLNFLTSSYFKLNQNAFSNNFLTYWQNNTRITIEMHRFTYEWIA